MKNTIYSINGPVVTIKGKTDLEMMEMVYVGKARLVGEVIRMNDKETTIQVYEETGGLKAGEPVESTGGPLSVTLGPGILRNIYDGIQRPLPAIEQHMGSFIERGAHEPSLDEAAKWDVTVTVRQGDTLTAGQIYATCPETPAIEHRCMVPPTVSGTVTWVADNGSYTVNEPIVKLTDAKGKEHTLTLCQKWPIRTPRPSAERMTSPRPLITGQRVIDTMFPLAKGGAAAIPGGFGTGKTMTQHQIAKWCDADIIIYVGCGERGNEMTQALQEFSELVDPRTGKSLMDRTVLIANTSNMPVAAREASVYTAMTICEYYRAMGLKCLLLADSTSRWAQALREMSNRMEELPGADAFPVDLSAIISNFYARAGMVVLNNGKTGAVTFIGTVSPAGGNLKEPVTESTKKAARCFYGLEQNRADQKRYPAVNPIESYSKYLEYPEIISYLDEQVEHGWVANVTKAKNLLRRGREANEQINILGDDGVPVAYHVSFWKSELIDFVFLQQDAFDETDALCPMDRQKYMLDLVLDICGIDFDFEDFEKCREFFKELINDLRQMNYTKFHSEGFENYAEKIHKLIEDYGK